MTSGRPSDRLGNAGLSLRSTINELIDNTLAVERDGGYFPPHATEDPRALLVDSTAALFSYYLDANGNVFELDLDKAFGRLEPVTDPDRIRATRLAAVRQHPELAALLSLQDE